MTIEVDKRSIQATRDPAADARIGRNLAALRNAQIDLARDLARIDASAHFVYSGCASVVEYAVSLGFGASEARVLTNLGKTLEASPDAEARIRSGEITVEAAAAIGRIFACPAVLREGDDWLEAAATEPLRALRRRIKQRFELHAEGDLGIEQLNMFVATRSKDDFARAREVASEKAGKRLTEGQTFTRVVDFYLEKNDPLRQSGRARRVGDTNGIPQSRYIPAEVKRTVLARAGGTCEVDGCEHKLGLEFAHRTPHRDGSGREADDIGALCRRHHVLYDAGRIAWPAKGMKGAESVPKDRLRERAPPLMASRGRAKTLLSASSSR